MKIWLKNCGKTQSEHYKAILAAAAIVLFASVFWEWVLWQGISTTLGSNLCVICEDGNGMRYQAPVLVNLSTGSKWELEIYDCDPRQPWEVAEEQSWHDWVFQFLDENATMSWSSEGHTNIAHIGDDLGKLNPEHFCHNCRTMLADIDSEGYAILDLYQIEDIQAFVVENGAEYTIRDYTVSIYKDNENGGLVVETSGHLFGGE